MPTNVPMVSNMSIMQNVMMSVMAVNHPISTKPAKLNLNSVSSNMSLNAGIHEAVARPAKGSVPRNSAWPAQWMTDATSMPMMTAPFTPRCASKMMTNKPTNIVTTARTMVG